MITDVTRAGDVTGIAPAGLINETYFDSSWSDAKPRASKALMEMSVAAWDAVSALNTELLSIIPVLFAPTAAGLSVTVAFSGENCTSDLLSDTPIRVIHKVLPGGSEYLLAANVDK